MALGPWRGRGSRPPSSRSECQTENHVLMVLDGAENHVLGRQMAVDIRHLDKWQSDRFFFALVVRTSGIGFLQININGRWSLFERSSECYRCITWRDGQMRDLAVDHSAVLAWRGKPVSLKRKLSTVARNRLCLVIFVGDCENLHERLWIETGTEEP
eukprot:CAMPEP_0174276888 /NCGR_PEP_ID=MMETSP0439-20130205/60590_1 /TAXON_ID=0 /ORGANISM="Stereomyxa ramosa, Strain Chinc5" /LENGTH=156 /DNA_ID=CAMNT_0015369157 /DNA_START=1197 /DNA_END=1667 /DNA_ORIENTATION=+